MKTIGLLGGMSWESSLEYYRIINEAVQARLGGLHSAQCLLYSFDFAEIEALQMRDDWDEAARKLSTAAQQLERGGADCLVICTNTMHKLADEIQQAVHIPLIHIADPTGEALLRAGHRRVGLLGTRFTMEHDFYRQRLVEKFGLDVIIPDSDGRKSIHDIIYDELVRGIIHEDSRRRYQQIIANMIDAGAEAIILGCTEICLLIQQEHSAAPVYDTTTLHALAAVDWALG